MADATPPTRAYHVPTRGMLYECNKCGMQLVITKDCKCDDKPECLPCFKCCGKEMSEVC